MAFEIEKRKRKNEMMSRRKRIDDSDNWWVNGCILSVAGMGVSAVGGIGTALFSLSTLSALSFGLAGLFFAAFLVFGMSGVVKLFGNTGQ